MPLRIGVGFTAVVVAWFVVTWLATDFAYAWNVLAGIESPHDRSPTLAVPLSILGFIVLPVFLGLAFAEGVERVVQSRLLTLEEAQDEVKKTFEGL